MIGPQWVTIVGGLTLVALYLLLALWRQIDQRRALARWLDDPMTRELPDGSGPWRDIFSRLQRWRKAEQRERDALGGSLDRFRQAAQAIPDGVILLGGTGHIEWFNGAASRQFGLDPARDVGTLIEQLIRQSAFHHYLQAFQARQTNEPLVLESAGPGHRRVLSILLLSFADAGTLLLSRDITDIARTETMRRDFIANVSHELRTPLTVVAGFLEQLSEPDAPSGEAARPFLNLMSEQTRRMVRLVEDLLTLSRLENGIEPPREEEVDVPALLETLINEANALSGGKHRIALDEVSAGRVRGSPDELRSAFGNLVSNAVRYTPPGGTVRLAWKRHGAAARFVVCDSGIGIPQQHLSRLTERFYRIDKGRSSATGGTGLGLAIVKHVLVRHQGQLFIESTPGKGSSFAAELPAARLIA